VTLKEYIAGFMSRSGAKVFSSMFLAKIIGFIISILMARILTKADFGNFTYAFTVVSFVLPFIGFGATQSLVYFGARITDKENIDKLFHYAFSRGVLLSLMLSLILCLCAEFLTKNQPNSTALLYILSLHISSYSVVQLIRNYFRLKNRNDLYASSENWYNVTLLAAALAGGYFFASAGYAWAMAIVPLVVGIYYVKKSGFRLKKPEGHIEISTKKFWKYGMFISIGAVAAQLMYMVDILTIGNLLTEYSGLRIPWGISRTDFISEQVAAYKICSIIPIASFILPSAILTTDFVNLSANSLDKEHLKTYAKNSMSILFPLSLLVTCILHFGSEYILLLFGSEYAGYSKLISIFSLSVIGAYTFRVPFGNMISAMGRADLNVYISLITLAMNIVLNFFFVINYGLEGAAWATTILIWVSGIINWLCFRHILNKL